MLVSRPAALDGIGGLLGVQEFAAAPAGYARLISWLQGFGTVGLVGIEGTGSYGAGLARHMMAAGIRVVEVDRSDRQDRRRQGKSDPLYAAGLSGRRAQFLDGQLDRLDELITPLVTARAPGLLAQGRPRHRRIPAHRCRRPPGPAAVRGRLGAPEAGPGAVGCAIADAARPSPPAGTP